MATLSELLADPKRQLLIKQRQVAMEFGIEVEKFLKRSQWKKSDLARRLGKSRAWISKLLDGPRNLKLFTAVEVADAIDCDVELRLVPRQAELRIPVAAQKFVAQTQAGAHAMTRCGTGIPPAEPTITVRNTVFAPTSTAALPI